MEERLKNVSLLQIIYNGINTVIHNHGFVEVDLLQTDVRIIPVVYILRVVKFLDLLISNTPHVIIACLELCYFITTI